MYQQTRIAPNRRRRRHIDVSSWLLLYNQCFRPSVPPSLLSPLLGVYMPTMAAAAVSSARRRLASVSCPVYRSRRRRAVTADGRLVMRRPSRFESIRHDDSNPTDKRRRTEFVFRFGAVTARLQTVGDYS